MRATLGAAAAGRAGQPAGLHLRPAGLHRRGEHVRRRQSLYKRFRQRQQVWQFGLDPDEVADFVAEYGWRLIEQAGPDYYCDNYIRPTGRDLGASQLEWAAYAVRSRASV